MSDPGLTPERLREGHADAVLKSSTFKTAGVGEQAAAHYLDTDAGPRMETIDEPLVKIVPRGESVSPHSPLFARQSAFEDAIARGHNLSEHFALPVRTPTHSSSGYAIAAIWPFSKQGSQRVLSQCKVQS